MADNSKLSEYLGLSSIPGIGDIRFRRLISHFQNPSAVFNADVEELAAAGKMSVNQANAIRRGYDQEKVSKLIAELSEKGISAIAVDDKDYPENLRKLYDPPPILYYKGDIRAANTHLIALVGSRKASAYGRSMAEKLSSELVEAGFTIVSGFARGIDTIAHKTAIQSGGMTVAVMGCGLDIIYPPDNKSLFTQVQQSGCVISEFKHGSPPEGGNFPKRNRIISGLSLGVVVIEAAQRSGALLTARHGLDQGKEVFAVPGPANVSSSDGANQLIKSGAKLTTSAADILEELKVQMAAPPVSKSEKKTMDKLTGEQKIIYQNLDGDGLQIDKLANMINIKMQDLLHHLLEMELAGYVRSLPGKRYARI